MKRVAVFVVCHILIGLAVLRVPTSKQVSATAAFPGWPEQFEGMPIYEVGLSPQEETWAQEFPGRMSRFSDGSREILIRYVERATRSLHPASDCLRAAGYAVEPLRVRRDRSERLWSCGRAERGESEFTFCEQIHDGTGRSWSDTSSWYWAALFDKGHRGYWAITIAF